MSTRSTIRPDRIEAFAVPAVDVELVAVRRYVLEEVARVFRVPSHLISAGPRLVDKVWY